MDEPDALALPGAIAQHRVVDAHVHAFPPALFEAIRRWFDRYAWPLRYRPDARATVRHLLDRGVAKVVVLAYAHVPGLAAELNRFVAALAADEPGVVPCATVCPGEPGARAILDEALGPLGCRGVKIHCHVSCVAPDDPRLDDVYAAAAAAGVPVVIHAGDGPASPHYRCDVRALCTVAALDRALARHPRTTVVVPHLGADRIDEIAALLARHERLHLDTTMTLGGFFPVDGTLRATDAARAPALLERALEVIRAHPERILYGSDFPNVPYAWDRELRALADAALPEATLAAVLHDNAARLFGA